MHSQPTTTVQWISAGATCAAVIVALFGPGVRGWLLRPRLTLHSDEDELPIHDFFDIEDAEPDSSVTVITLVVANHGRGQADDVEAILTARARITMGGGAKGDAKTPPDFDLAVVSQGALRFELARDGDGRISVPPRTSRTLHLVMLGRDSHLRKELTDAGATLPGDHLPVDAIFCVLPARYAERSNRIVLDDLYTIEIQLQAKNAKPTRWSASFKVFRWQLPADDEGGSTATNLSFEWVTPLKGVRLRPVKTPWRKTIARRSPRTLWSNYRLRREIKRQEEAATSGDDA